MITSLDQVSEFPLTWPDGKSRTSRRERSKFKTTLAKARQEIEWEMPRWRARGFVISMAPAYRRADYDPAVAVWWNMPLRQNQTTPDLRVIACDRYDRPEDNAHAVALTLAGLRSFERYGTYTLHQAAEGARPMLPPPARENDAEPWWMTLGVQREWPIDAIEAIYKSKAEKAHPDRGGSVERMTALNVAIDLARTEKR